MYKLCLILILFIVIISLSILIILNPTLLEAFSLEGNHNNFCYEILDKVFS